MGAGVTRVAPGDVVAIHHHVACGACRVCAAGHETLCPQFRATRLDPGGFAEHVRDPARARRRAAAARRPRSCRRHVHRAARLRAARPGSRRARPRATRCSWSARARAACCTSARRAPAASSGVLVAEPRAGPARARARVGRRRRSRRASRSTWRSSPRITRRRSRQRAAALGPGGRLCAYAPPEPGAPIAVDGARDLPARADRHRRPGRRAPATWRAALALLRSGAVRVDGLVTHRFGLDETGAALAAQRDGSALKAVVLPWGDP